MIGRVNIFVVNASGTQRSRYFRKFETRGITPMTVRARLLRVIFFKDVWIAAEGTLPQIVSEDHDRIFLGAVLVERCAELRRNTEDLKEPV